MTTFYKIENGNLEFGSGTVMPVGFIEYTEGAEPQEFLDAKVLMETSETLIYNIAQARKYLRDTDWYYVRQIEESIAVPQAIIDERITQKTFIRDNEV